MYDYNMNNFKTFFLLFTSLLVGLSLYIFLAIKYPHSVHHSLPIYNIIFNTRVLFFHIMKNLKKLPIKRRKNLLSLFKDKVAHPRIVISRYVKKNAVLIVSFLFLLEN